MVALIKPQFELQPNQVGKGGIVREEELRMPQCQQDPALCDRTVAPGMARGHRVADNGR